MERRKLGKRLSDPIINMSRVPWLDGVRFIEINHKEALKTRAAAGMFIKRHDLDLTTMVKDNIILVLKDKDIMEELETIAL